jgi:hypothetical protein
MVKPFVLAGTLLALCSCMPNPCANSQITEDVSPDGKLKAVTFRRDCGATTKETVQVSILHADKSLPNEAGNIFVASGTPIVVVRWITARRLSISGGGASGAFKSEKSFGDVEITYD